MLLILTHLKVIYDLGLSICLKDYENVSETVTSHFHMISASQTKALLEL